MCIGVYTYDSIAVFHLLVNCVLSMFLRRYHRLGMATVDQVVNLLAKYLSVFTCVICCLPCLRTSVRCSFVKSNVFSVAMCIFNYVIHSWVSTTNTLNSFLTLARISLAYWIAGVSLLVALCSNPFYLATSVPGTMPTPSVPHQPTIDAYERGREYRMGKETRRHVVMKYLKGNATRSESTYNSTTENQHRIPMKIS